MRTCLITVIFGLSLCIPMVAGCDRQSRTASLAGAQGGAAGAAGIPAVEWVLELRGPGLRKPRNFTYQGLAQMEMTRLENVLQQRTHLPDEVSSWEGPALDLLLAKAEIKLGPMLLTMEAVDGYAMKREREDLKSAIVALKDGNGRWLAEVGDRYPLRLVPPYTTGNYWVRNLTRITVEPAPDSLLGPP